MTRIYNEPEFKVVKMAKEDVLTASKLDPISAGWETNPVDPGEGTVPFINL